jgi:hypothetical protein
MDGKLYVYTCTAPGQLSEVRPLANESMRTGVRTLLCSGKVMISGSEDGHVALWSVGDETVQVTLSVHSNIVSTICDVGGQVW